jgi:hypothetical protein
MHSCVSSAQFNGSLFLKISSHPSSADMLHLGSTHSPTPYRLPLFKSSIAIIRSLPSVHSAQWVALKALLQVGSAAHFPGNGIIQSPLGVILKPDLHV